MHKIKKLTTRRLVLRLVKITDAQEIFISYASSSLVTKFLSWRPHKSIETVRREIKKFRINSYRSGQCLPWVIIKLADKSIIGMIELRPSAEGAQSHVGEIGFALAESEWGNGYMSEALKEVITFAFEVLKLKRIWAYCDSSNKASAKVMANAGMKREGILHSFVVHPNISEKPRNCMCFAIWQK